MRILSKTFSRLAFIAITACSPSIEKTDNQEVIDQTLKAYREAWIQGDGDLVMTFLSDDVKLFSASKTTQPIVGKEAVQASWFPTSDISYPIYKYEITNQEIHVDQKLAVVNGISRMHWCTLEYGVGRDSTQSITEFTSVLRKEQEEWKILRQMYNMKDEDYAY